MNPINRRDFAKSVGALSLVSAAGISGCATLGGVAKPKVIVVGGGYGGASAATYSSPAGAGKNRG